MSKKFFEKYKDPRWQKKRLEIMERDDFSCSNCGDDEETLNVHHKYYIKDTDPWDYDSEVFITLCECCHEEEHDIKSDMNHFLCKIKTYFSSYELACMFEGIAKEYELERDKDCDKMHPMNLTSFIINGVSSGLLVNVGKFVLEERSKARKSKRENKEAINNG